MHRFYFLSNAEIVAILSQAREPRMLQKHLSKCFKSIARLEFAATKEADLSGLIVAMVSPQGERVEFTTVSHSNIVCSRPNKVIASIP